MSIYSRKCYFLGHILSGEGIRTEFGKVQEILRFSVPETCSEVKSFLGMASFSENLCLIFLSMQQLFLSY